MNLDELKSTLARFNIKPDKRLGQNFLLSETVLDEIVAAAELKSGDIVLEIGPGLGVLTRRLAQAAGEVIAVEKDRKIARVLRKLFKNKKNVKIVEGDALNINNFVIARSYKLVANIPYYITGKLLQSALGGLTRPSLMVLLLQKEVAERIVAKPGEMSVLSVSVQMYANAEIISFVGRENFYPMPEVDSAIVRLRVLPRARFAVDEAKFFQLVKMGFANKRKQLHNNLSVIVRGNSLLSLRGAELRSNLKGNEIATASGLAMTENIPATRDDGADFKRILTSLGLNPLCRAQDLSLSDWERLYQILFLP